MQPIRPILGLHVVIYLTFVVSLVAGVVDVIRSEDFSPRARILRGLLVYSGLFGLGAGAYWVGRSDPVALFGMFPTWGLSVAILCGAVLRVAATRPPMEPATLAPARVAGNRCPARLRAHDHRCGSDSFPRLAGATVHWRGSRHPPYAARVQFISDRTVREEPVAILAPVGHLLARDAGVLNVSPYAFEASIVFYEQMDLLLGIIRKSGATKVFVGPTWAETSAYLAEKGFVAIASDAASELTAWQQSPGPGGLTPRRAPACRPDLIRHVAAVEPGVVAPAGVEPTPVGSHRRWRS